MTSTSMADLLKQAKESGQSFGSLPEGNHALVIEKWNLRDNQGKQTTTLGLMLRITAGPEAGTTGWVNQNFGVGNPAGTGFLFRMFDSLGIPETYYSDPAVTLEQVAEQLVGRAFQADVTLTAAKKEGGKPFVNLKNISLSTGAPVAAAPAPAPAPAPQVPVPAPAPPVPAPAPAAAPVPAPAAPAPAVPVDPSTGVPEPF
jgi:hypothetical protein